MAGDRTTVTELATALGMLRYRTVGDAIAARAPELGLDADQWAALERLAAGGEHDDAFARGFANGERFLAARDGLRHRPPVLIEWTGGRKAPGDEVAPIDLRVDHVYLISCKYFSRVLANPSPGRVFDGLLATTRTWSTADWFAVTAAAEYQELYHRCRQATGLWSLPAAVDELRPEQRRQLRDALGRGTPFPDEAQTAYAELAAAVSLATATRWQASIVAGDAEALLWRLLRIGSAPYFVLGADTDGATQLRVASPWDWRQEFELAGFAVEAAGAGQPQVNWTATVRPRRPGAVRRVGGHVEIRWSHGRFCGKPEAKVYLDTPIHDVPGYHPLT